MTKIEVKKGDKVKILKHVRDYESIINVLETIGMTGEVRGIYEDGCEVYFSGIDDSWWYRYEAIEKVEGSKEEDIVNHPSHYTFFQKEVIDVIKECLKPEEFKGYLKGNIIKYRMRAGIRGGTEKRQEDLDKSNWYQDRLCVLEKK